ncbi:hypothetical protein [Spirosoma agri]|uniref:Uncharacterized protein n=1 Tax=Spirosoma agri TaxID=1987381 RepID=A0A6M0IEH8_9BACT|nr:hypothetical protein [Spirosoma agri]NEU65741.1 hypothetical protein [Spirosoma agri]
MKIIYLLVVALILLAGCSPKVQVITLRGSNVKPTTEGLVLDNDTLTLQYSFASERGQMKVSITNKLNQPLYIDWKRSSLIFGQEKVDYWSDVANVQLSSYGGYRSRYSITTSGTIAKEDQVSFIPPRTRLYKQQFVVVPRGALALSGTPDIMPEKSLWRPEQKKPVMVDIFSYSAEKSPLTFRNYLTLSTDKDFKNEFYIDTQFWASNVQVMPLYQLTGPVRQYDGSYSSLLPFKQPDGFYVPVPAQ